MVCNFWEVLLTIEARWRLVSRGFYWGQSGRHTALAGLTSVTQISAPSEQKQVFAINYVANIKLFDQICTAWPMSLGIKKKAFITDNTVSIN